MNNLRFSSMRFTAVAATILYVRMAAVSAQDAHNLAPMPNASLSPFAKFTDIYPIMPWDSIRNQTPGLDPEKSLQAIADCQFTLAGFVQTEDLPLCKKNGLMAILRPSNSNNVAMGRWTDLSDAEIEQRVRTLIGQTADDPNVLGYYITDEPRANAFPALGKAVAVVKKLAPGKLAYINLFPSYSTIDAGKSELEADTYEEYLERFVTEVRPQLISYDNYLIIHTDDMQKKSTPGIYFRNLLQVREVAQKHGLPYWNICCGNQIRPLTSIPSPANLSLQAYTTLAAGFRGIAWYKFFHHAEGRVGYKYASFDSVGNKTATYLALQAVNRQLRALGPIVNRLESTAVLFSSPPPYESLPTLPGRVVKAVRTTTSPRGFASISPPVMVGEFKDASGKDYALVVNLSLERSIYFDLETAKDYRQIQVYSPVEGKLSPFGDREGHWLTPGQGELIRFE